MSLLLTTLTRPPPSIQLSKNSSQMGAEAHFASCERTSEITVVDSAVYFPKINLLYLICFFILVLDVPEGGDGGTG